MTNEEFNERIKIIFGKHFKDYLILSEYKNDKTKIKIKHLTCGSIFERNFNSLLTAVKRNKNNNCFCPICNLKYKNNKLKEIGKNNKKDNDLFKKEFYSKSNGEYELLSNYNGKDKNIKIKHITCGAIYETLASVYLQGCRCPICAKNKIVSAAKKKQLKHMKNLLRNVMKKEMT